ncbi:MAG: extracellular solute-binding protein [Clostridia bacterium]|nr:extracellular solute-binding protein [Clostridia bacterium]
MKTQLRIVCMMLVVLMCITAVACAQPSDDTEDTTTAAPFDNTPSGETESSPAETQPDSVSSSIPDELDFGNDTVTFLYWDDVERAEFFADGITGDNVNDAIYQRNINVEENLGVTLKYIGEPGNVNNSDGFLKHVQNSFNAGEREYDILASHSRTGGVVAAAGMAMDLADIDDSYIDTSKPWWPSSMVDTATIGDKMYFISGDISTNTLHFMYGVYYNMDMITNLGLEDPTDLALSYDWTLDKMIAMSANLYQDLNNDGKKGYGDAFGLTTLYYHADSFYSAAGMSWIDKDANGELRVSPDYTSEKAINLAEKLAAWFGTSDCYTENNNKNTYTIFADGNSLFAQNRIYIADSAHDSGLNSADFKYGVVPVPMYDENQDEYYTTVGNPFTLYEVMVNCDKTEMTTAVLECLAEQGYNLTTPAIFEVNMKYKYSLYDKTAQAFDLIRNGIVFDLGRIFGENLNKMSEVYSRTCIEGQSWATAAASQSRVIERLLNNLVESFE